MKKKVVYNSAPLLDQKSSTVSNSNNTSREDIVDTMLDVDEASIHTHSNIFDQDDCEEKLQELITSLSVEDGLDKTQ